MFSRYSQCVFVGLVVMVLYICATTTGTNLAIIHTNNGKRTFVNLNTNGLEIIGIASLKHKLYVVCVGNDTIFEFSMKNHALMKTYKVSGMAGPGDIVADPTSNQLFIIDWHPAAEGGTRVWRFKPSSGQHFYYNNATHWTGTLSFSARRKIVGVSGSGGLNLYSSASGLTTYQMPASVVDPQHAIIPTRRGNVFVSYGGFWANETNTVVKLNADASAVLSVATTPMSWPRHLAFGGRKRQHVFVADYCNRRVIRFDSQLSASQVILSSDSSASVGWPQRLLFDKSTKDLYVAMTSTPLC